MSAYLIIAKKAPELTTSLSEALEGISVANCAGNDDFDTRTKIEEHANGGN